MRKLFALEVPEIADGTVEIAALAREAGHRTKIAVHSKVPGLNAKGACIGPMGARVRAVMTELHGEKIDIVDYSDDPRTFVAAALSPSRVESVEIVDPQLRAARVVVLDYQLSLAIGKEGQNARLAAKLTVAHRHPPGHRPHRAGWRARRRPRDGIPAEGLRRRRWRTPVAERGRVVGTDRTGLRTRTTRTTPRRARAARFGRVWDAVGRIAGRHSCEWSRRRTRTVYSGSFRIRGVVCRGAAHGCTPRATALSKLSDAGPSGVRCAPAPPPTGSGHGTSHGPRAEETVRQGNRKRV